MTDVDAINDADLSGVRGNFTNETYTYFPSHDSAPLCALAQCASTTVGGAIVSKDHDATGMMIWPATHALCQELCSQSPSRPLKLYDDAAVLELGCGCGLVGIVALLSNHSPSIRLWVSTDMDARALALTELNFQQNRILVNQPGARVQTKALRWGNGSHIASVVELLESSSPVNATSDHAHKTLFDFVVGADIVYPSTCGDALVELFRTVDRAMKPNGIFYLSFASRDGVRTPSRFLDAATQAGFIVDVLPPIEDRIRQLLPPLLDSKILVLTRHVDAMLHNQKIGGASCQIFPGLGQGLLALNSNCNDLEEWDPPPCDDSD